MFNAWITNVVAKGLPGPALENLYALEYFYYDMEGFEDEETVRKTKEYTDDDLLKLLHAEAETCLKIDFNQENIRIVHNV